MDRSFSPSGTALPNRGSAADYPVLQRAAPALQLSANAYRSQKLLRVFVLCAVFLGTWRVFRFGWTNFTYSDVFLIMAGLTLLVRGQLNAKPFGAMSSLWYLGFAALIGGLLAGSLAHGEPSHWFIGSTQYFFAFVILPMLFTSVERPLLLQCVKVFVIGVALSQVIGILAGQFFDWRDTYWTVDHGFITPNGRIGAMSGEANLNGAACAFGLPMLAYLYFNRSVTAWFAMACGFIIGLGLLMSASFTGFSAAALALVVMFASSGMGGMAKVGVPLVLLTACYVLMGGPMPEIFNARVGDALATGDLSMAGTFIERSQLIAEAWAMLDRNVLLGLGLDGYRIESVYGLPVHNLFLLMANEGGLFSIAGLLALMAILVAAFVGVYRTHRLEGGLGLAVLMVFLVYALAIPHMYTRMWTIPICLCLGLAYQAQRSSLPKMAS